MKKITAFFAVLFLSILFLNSSYSQTYTLEVRNMTLNNPTDNILEFDIYITRTGAIPFDYAAGRFNFYFNPLIANGGTLTYSFVPGFSDLPVTLQPFGPSIVADRLNMTINSFPGSGNGFLISNISPGTRVCRMRLETSAPVFNINPLDLSWNNPGSLNPPRTVVYAYNSDGDEINVTTPATHSIDSSGLNGQPLPVELSSFTSVINSNNVKLNWTTASELNNSGFDIERKSSSESWTKISFVNGNGTSNSPTNYSYSDISLAAGNYSYRLKQIDLNGNFEYFELGTEVNIGLPEKFNLSQNYPNPFNPTTSVNFDIPFDGNVTLKIFDMSGKEVKELVNEYRSAGFYNIQINGADLSSGTYFYNLTSAGNNQTFTSTKKMVLVK
jgi:Secretion system C-terminal sorting domain